MFENVLTYPRPRLLESLVAHMGTDEVKVLTGVRRCGKSTLLRMFADRLRANGIAESNLFFKQLDAAGLPFDYAARDLYEELSAAYRAADKNGTFVILLDEVQEVAGWEKVVRRFQTQPDTDIYLTGSNAMLLSGELATYIAGRYVEIPVYPFSFEEYVSCRALQDESSDSPDVLLADYMRYGGMPALLAMGPADESRAAEVLDAIFNTIVVKDVASRYGIRDLATFDKIARYLFATSGNLFSVRRIVNTLKSSGVVISPQTLDEQIRMLEQAFVIYAAEQSGLRGKQILRSQRKYYPVDNGFRNYALGFAGVDAGFQLEGIVYMELLRRGWTVQVGALPTGEVDFVARRGSAMRYVQVTASMADEATRERELAPLRAVGDSFPKVVVTLEPYGVGTTQDGITVIRAVDWLLDVDGDMGDR